MKKSMKCILNLRTARYLLSRGCTMVDVDYSRKRNGSLVFVFVNDGLLSKSLTELAEGAK